MLKQLLNQLHPIPQSYITCTPHYLSLSVLTRLCLSLSFCHSSELRECGGDGLRDRGGGQAASVRGRPPDQRHGQPSQPHQPRGLATGREPQPADQGGGGRRDAGQRRGAHLARQRHAECFGRRYW